MGPKKSLGQNFLTSPAIAEQIVNASGITNRDTVLEIGPGKGILTQFLSQRAKTVLAVEKDHILAQYEYGPNVSVLEADIRDIAVEALPLPATYHVVANIPYYITGEIIRTFLSAQKQPKSMTLLIQREVAERIVTRNGKESVLSLSVQAYGKPVYVRHVSAGAFFPKPNVDSAVLHIAEISRKNFKNEEHERFFFQLIKKAFNGKRKTLAHTIGKMIVVPQELCMSRPETVPLATWLLLSYAEKIHDGDLKR